MVAYAEKNYVWMGFRTLLGLPTTISIVKDILLAGNMPAADPGTKPFIFCYPRPIHKSIKYGDNITCQTNRNQIRSPVEKENGTLNTEATSDDLLHATRLSLRAFKVN
jgi:hypothetical protein